MDEIEGRDAVGVGTGEANGSLVRDPPLDPRSAGWFRGWEDRYNPTVVREGERRRKDLWNWRRW